MSGLSKLIRVLDILIALFIVVTIILALRGVINKDMQHGLIITLSLVLPVAYGFLRLASIAGRFVLQLMANGFPSTLNKPTSYGPTPLKDLIIFVIVGLAEFLLILLVGIYVVKHS